jgi:hypothetical protein
LEPQGAEHGLAAGDASSSVAEAEGRLVLANGLPMRRYRPLRPVMVRVGETNRPEAVQMQAGREWLRVITAQGPWLMSGDWWSSDSWEREVWEVAVSDGVLYQLVREKHGWVLDGVFG